MVMVNGKVLPKDDWHRKYYWDLRKNAWNCSRCSNCKWVDSWEVKSARFARVCPSSAYYMYDAYSCQGRMDVALALIDGRIKYEDSPTLPDVFNRCNACGGCDAMCKRVQDMEPLRVIQEMRQKLAGDGQLVASHIPVIEGLRKDDNMLGLPKADRGRWMEGLKVKDLTRDKADVVFHAGCKASYDREQWPVLRGVVEMMLQAGLDVGVMGSAESCCGGRALEMGYRGELVKFAESNIQSWRNAGVKTVVTACADGYWTFKQAYAEFNPGVEVLHVVEMLERMVGQGKLKFNRPVPMTVTWHDPCHLGRRANIYQPGKAIMGVYDAPRNLLKAIPGVKLVEMERIKEYAWCCGAGAGVKEAYPDFNLFTARERVDEAQATGAQALVTACPWCEGNFREVLRENGAIRVMDIVELVMRSAGGV
jgi:Fe-S oxidoreductase